MIEERHPDLGWEEDFMVYNDREDNWKEAEEDYNEYRTKVNSLRWEVYMKYKEELINRQFWVMVMHPKGWCGGGLELCGG